MTSSEQPITQPDPLEKYREYIREMERDLAEVQVELLDMEKQMEEIKAIFIKEKAIERSMNVIILVPKEGMSWMTYCEGMLGAERDRLAELKVRYDGLVQKKEMLADLITQYDKEKSLK